MKETGAKIRAICISEKRGTAKHEVEAAVLKEGYGIGGDAHAGNWHRQVSILSADRVDEFNEKGAKVRNGDFGENILVEGIDCVKLPIGSTLTIGDGEDAVILRLTQRGKECHTHCRIYKRMGECIMPHQGVFSEVIHGGTIKKGDPVIIGYPDINRPYQAAVIVLSDRASQGEYEDLSGPKACDILKDNGYEIIESLLIPDDKERLKTELIRLCDGREADLILTSGGTGFAVRDITPEATLEVASRNAPGIAEYMRMRSAKITDRAMLSRAVSVIRGHSVIVNLPGSPKAVEECLGFILGALDHGIRILRGEKPE